MPHCKVLLVTKEPPSLQLQLIDVANRKLLKNTIQWNVLTGKLVRTASDQAPSKEAIPYKLALNGLVVDAATKTVQSLKDVIAKTGATGVHGFKEFPAGLPGVKLSPDGVGHL